MGKKENKTPEKQIWYSQEYQKKNDRVNVVFPAGTRERMEALGIKSAAPFIKKTVAAELDQMEREKGKGKREKKMEKFNHYGVEVVYQVIGIPFEDVLKENGVEYTALPYIDDIVFRYEKDGQRKYAYIVVEKLIDDYAERVYITSEIPEDLSWKGIAEDYRNQKSGERPAELHTRAYMIFTAAYNDALRNMPFTFDMNAAPGKRDIAYALIKYYVSIDDLKEMDHHDCPMIDEF